MVVWTGIRYFPTPNLPLPHAMASLSHASASQTLALPDGRTLGYATFGPPASPDTPTIVYCHGFPGSRLEASFLERQQRPFHVISIDRPGMGLSTFQPSRRIIDWPSDVLALLDHLRIHTFYVLGDSGGSPYALACAKQIPRERLLGVSVVSGIYLFGLGMQGMSLLAKALLLAGTWLPTSVIAKLMDWEFGAVTKTTDPKESEAAFMKAMEGKSEGDIRCLDDLDFRCIVVESMKEAFRDGSRGPAWDLGILGQWGFELEELDCDNISLWHGKKDVNAPFLMAEKAAKVIKACTFHALEDESHLSLPYNLLDPILEDLLGGT